MFVRANNSYAKQVAKLEMVAAIGHEGSQPFAPERSMSVDFTALFPAKTSCELYSSFSASAASFVGASFVERSK